jgi:CheY-like chemotaxis protein
MARGGFFAVDSLASVHVLVVDDDAAFRDVLASLLRYCGALVTAVTTPEEALMAMGQVKPDALVITIAPDGRNVSLARRVRARKPEDGGNAPIVAVLREGAHDDVPEGINVHLTEPLNPWELCRVISTLLATG